jgi:stage III sporulation protein AA
LKAAALPFTAKEYAKDNPVNEILPVLPSNLRALVASMPDQVKEQVEEIRIRQGRPLVVGIASSETFIKADGSLTSRAPEAYRVTPDDMDRVVQLLSGSSLYALEEELRNGFITLPGGHRVGITGKAVLEGGKIRTLKFLTGCNIRISREIPGAGEHVLPHIIDRNRRSIYHTLLLSPPGCGKTTILRDLVRQISNGIPAMRFAGINVGLVDERSEIAGCYKGVPQKDVGVRTDVLDGCPKAEGMMMLLRSMAPAVIAADEIGRREDVDALEEVLNAGVKILITAHGVSPDDLAVRPVLTRLIHAKMIERFVILGRSRGVGTIEDIIDGRSMRSLGVRKC